MLEFYERTAGAHESWAGGVHGRAARRLAELAAPVAGEQVLDVGCGTGLVARHLATGVAPEGRAVGIDPSAPMLAVARRRSGGRAVFLEMAAEKMFFPDQSFDLITLGQSLPFVDDPDAVLAEAFRVLKPGGRIVVCCQRRSLSTRAQTVFFACLGRLARRHPMRVPRPPEDRATFGEPRVLVSLLADAGFVALSRSQTIIGGSAGDARSWAELMAAAGPYPHALISVLGPGARARFEGELNTLMDELGDEAFRLHFVFTYGLGRRPAGASP